MGALYGTAAQWSLAGGRGSVAMMVQMTGSPSLSFTETPAKTSRVFYGWWVVGAVFIVLMTSSGIGFYNTSVIIKASHDQFGFSIGAASIGATIFFVISGCSGFFLGGLITRFDVRLTITFGAVLGAVALLGLAAVSELWQLYAFYALFGVAFAAAGLVPGLTLVTRWFHQKRAVAISVASTGLSLGGIVVTPISANLIKSRDLAGAAPLLAAIWLVGILPLTWLIIRSTPESKGLTPDGDEAGSTATGTSMVGIDFDQAVQTRFFQLISLAFALLLAAQVGAIAHLYNLGSERVADGDTTAAFLVALLAGSSVVGRLVGGVVASRIPARLLAVGLGLVQAVALVAMALADVRFALIGAVILLGLSVGNVLMLQPLILAEAFGVRDYARIYGLGQLMGVLGVGIGPAVVGLIHDSDSYRSALLVASGIAVVGSLVALWAGPTDQRALRPMIEIR
ncbi:MAG: MFS transporter [Actinomycetia bacterium]|nr:MFS transporter [Actinomycetes bacterium]